MMFKSRAHILRSPLVSSSTYTCTQVASIYKFPSPTFAKKSVTVMSLGGGLFGTVNPTTNAVTDGDVQAYWTSLGIPSDTFPTVILKLLPGATNDTDDLDSTVENTIDVQTIGGCCPTSNLTITLIIAPNTMSGFASCFQACIDAKPNVVSCSWGLPERYVPRSSLMELNAMFEAATASGINICTASGDDGSSDGLSGNNVDFPSSSPYVMACGGTNLVCPEYVYTSNTLETAWRYGGGGVSDFFAKPEYQQSVGGSTTMRNTPDVALVADPNTGVRYLVNNKSMVVGGTSIVSPAMSAFLLAALKTDVFVNPLLYKHDSAAFHDITIGNNGAFACQPGYDNCTGLGSIVGDVLLRDT
jgi:kumamolisin